MFSLILLKRWLFVKYLFIKALSRPKADKLKKMVQKGKLMNPKNDSLFFLFQQPVPHYRLLIPIDKCKNSCS